MSRFELNISLGYLHTWGIVDAVREIFQNAYDEEVVNPENKMYFKYEDGTLTVGNKQGRLDKRTLLLGESTKRDNENTIGKYGEGYKVASVVLLRLGKGLKIYNRADREVWTARVSKSRRYGTDIAVVDVEKMSIFRREPNCDLLFEVSGITDEEYAQIVESNLHLQELGVDSYLQAGDSKVLTDEKHAGKIFVGGLYVTTSKKCVYGYDLHPSLLHLDRDRRLVDNLDLQFILGRVLCRLTDVEFLMSAKEKWDGEYLRFYLGHNLVAGDLYEREFDKFYQKHGKDAVPCSDEDTFNRLRRNGFNAVLVSDNTLYYVSNSGRYTESLYLDEDEGELLAEKLRNWFDTYIEEGTEAHEKGKQLIEDVITLLKN